MKFQRDDLVLGTHTFSQIPAGEVFYQTKDPDVLFLKLANNPSINYNCVNLTLSRHWLFTCQEEKQFVILNSHLVTYPVRKI